MTLAFCQNSHFLDPPLEILIQWMGCLWCSQCTTQEFGNQLFFKSFHCTDEEAELSLQLEWEKLESGSRYLRDIEGEEWETKVLISTSPEGPCCGQWGGEFRCAQACHRVTRCPTVRWLTGHRNILCLCWIYSLDVSWLLTRALFLEADPALTGGDRS